MSKKKHQAKTKNALILLCQKYLKEDSCKSAVLKTIWYKNIFNYPLTFHQISTALISNKPYEVSEIKDALNELFGNNILEFKHGTYHLNHLETINRTQRVNNSNDLMKEATEISRHLRVIPWIKLLAVTGSVAAYNADKDHDIDIFIITTKNRIWLTRLLTVLLLKTLNKYRTENSYAGKICPNIYVDESQMEWQTQNRNIYVAHEIKMMHPLINRNNTYFKFLAKNKWIGDFFVADEPVLFLENSELKQSKIFDGLELIARYLQLAVMHHHKTTEVTNKDLIHFNKMDWSKKIITEYEKLFQDIHQLGAQ